MFRYNHNQDILKGAKALEKIFNHASDRKVDKNLVFNYKIESQGLGVLLANEGNNLAFLSSHINNVLIRWDSGIARSKFGLEPNNP